MAGANAAKPASTAYVEGSRMALTATTSRNTSAPGFEPETSVKRSRLVTVSAVKVKE
jgi:hypothetical protein